MSWLSENNYKLIKIIGHGTFGIVYSIKNSDNEVYALKKSLPHDKYYFNIEAINEIQILRDLKGVKGVAQIHNYYIIKETVYMIMDKYHISLYDLVCRGPHVYTNKCYQVTKQLIYALARIHSLGIIHCDLKLNNIMLNVLPGKTIELFLIDWGLSHNQNYMTSSNKLVKPREILIPSHRPIECYLHKFYNEKVDIWSAACIIYYIYNDFPLFSGNDEIDALINIMSKIQIPQEAQLDLIQKYKITSVPKYRGEIKTSDNMPNEIFQLIKNSIIFDPEERMSAHDLATNFLSNNDVHAKAQPSVLEEKKLPVVRIRNLTNVYDHGTKVKIRNTVFDFLLQLYYEGYTTTNDFNEAIDIYDHIQLKFTDLPNLNDHILLMGAIANICDSNLYINEIADKFKSILLDLSIEDIKTQIYYYVIEVIKILDADVNCKTMVKMIYDDLRDMGLSNIDEINSLSTTEPLNYIIISILKNTEFISDNRKNIARVLAVIYHYQTTGTKGDFNFAKTDATQVVDYIRKCIAQNPNNNNNNFLEEFDIMSIVKYINDFALIYCQS